MIKLRRLFVAAVLTASLAFWFVQRRTITRLEVRIAKLRAETTRIVDLEPVRAENRRLAEQKALAEELDRLRATTRNSLSFEHDWLNSSRRRKAFQMKPQPKTKRA